MLKSGAFVSEPQQSYNATWRTLEPSEPKGKSNYNNIKWIIFHLQKEFYDWTCDHFNLSLICFNSVFRRLWPGQTTSRTLAFQMTFLIWMTSRYWYVDLYCIHWLFINNFFFFWRLRQIRLITQWIIFHHLPCISYDLSHLGDVIYPFFLSWQRIIYSNIFCRTWASTSWQKFQGIWRILGICWS